MPSFTPCFHFPILVGFMKRNSLVSHFAFSITVVLGAGVAHSKRHCRQSHVLFIVAQSRVILKAVYSCLKLRSGVACISCYILSRSLTDAIWVRLACMLFQLHAALKTETNVRAELNIFGLFTSLFLCNSAPEDATAYHVKTARPDNGGHL